MDRMAIVLFSCLLFVTGSQARGSPSRNLLQVRSGSSHVLTKCDCARSFLEEQKQGLGWLPPRSLPACVAAARGFYPYVFTTIIAVDTLHLLTGTVALQTTYGDNTSNSTIAASSSTTSYFAPHWGGSFQAANYPVNQGQWAPASAPANSSAIFYMDTANECALTTCQLSSTPLLLHIRGRLVHYLDPCPALIKTAVLMGLWWPSVQA